MGAVWPRMRAEGIAGVERLAWTEYGCAEDADLDDVEQWHVANPALGIRLYLETVLNERAALSDDGFGRERLGIWGSAKRASVLDSRVWADLTDRLPQMDRAPVLDPVAFAIDVPPERGLATIGMAAKRADGLPLVEVIPDDADNPELKLSGTDWVVARVLGLVEKWKPCAVLLDRKAAGSLLDDLRAAGLAVVTLAGWDEQKSGQVVATGMTEMEQACGGFYDAVTAGKLRHIGQPALNMAVDQARKRPLGDAWAWQRRDANTDLSPLVAVTLALFGHAKFGCTVPKTYEAFEF